MGKLFTSKQIKKLKEAEKYFNTVLNLQYKMATPSSLNELVVDVYEEATGETLKRNFSCNKCCYNIYATVGRLYYNSIEAIRKAKQDNMAKARGAKADKADKGSEQKRSLTEVNEQDQGEAKEEQK